MRSTLRIFVLGATFVVIVIGAIPTAQHMNDLHFRKQSAIDACLAATRSAIITQLQGELSAPQTSAIAVGTRFSHVGGRTTGLAELDGDIALQESHKNRSDILAVWEFSGYADIPGTLPIGDSNRNTFSCAAVVFTDRSVATYGAEVTAWQPGDVVG